MNQLVQLSRQVQYLFIALLFASFAVVQSAIGGGFVEGTKLTGKMWELPTHFKGNTGQCAGGDEVEVYGKLQVEFVVQPRPDGKKVVLPRTVEENGKLFLPKHASKDVRGDGRTSRRTYRVDKVQVEKGSAYPATKFNKFGSGAFRLRIFFVGNPNRVNTAQGDVSPGKVFTFSVVYEEVDYSWNSEKQDDVNLFGYPLRFVKLDCP